MDFECVCEPYEGESCEFSEKRTVKARKPHKCCECSETIQVGEQHEVLVYRVEGEFGQDRTCAFCAAERTRLSAAHPDLPPVIGELACWLVAELRGDL